MSFYHFQFSFSDDGSWATPAVWPECFASINCSSPPPDRDPAGTWEWSGAFIYQTEVLYTCGPYGKFLLQDGSFADSVVSYCDWSKEWVPSELPSCVASSCPLIPFPPKSSGLIFKPDEENEFSIVSKTSKYSPRMPVIMAFPKETCEQSKIAMIVGKVLSDDKDSSVDIVMKTKDQDEAFHVTIALGHETIYRYAVQNGTVYNLFGQIGDGTTIDLEEPFVLRLACDGDGWVLQVNDELPYDHFLHVIPHNEIDYLEVSGDAELSFVGFGDKNMEPAPSLTFNITFVCPPGICGFWFILSLEFCLLLDQVFASDWYATPFIMMTCQDSGVFDAPEDWSQYHCEIRKFSIALIFYPYQ